MSFKPRFQCLVIVLALVFTFTSCEIFFGHDRDNVKVSIKFYNFRDVDIGDKLTMGSAAAIVGHPRRHGQTLLDQLRIEIVHQRSVIEQMVAFGTHAVARDFQLPYGQIACPSATNAWN